MNGKEPTNITKAPNITLKINSISSDGTGIARTERGIIFVQGALPGEVVKAELVAKKKDFAVAKIFEIVEASPGRVAPRCKYYGHCGGCQLQHADYETQLKLKAQIVRDAMTRIGGFEKNLFENLTCQASPLFWGYRNKAAFPVQNLNGRIATGFYRAGTHRPELIKQCPVNAPRLNEIYGAILDGLDGLEKEKNKFPLDGYDERTNKGKLRHIIARTGINTGESLLSFVINGKLSPKSVKSLAYLGELSSPDTITLNHNSKPGNVILGSYTENLKSSGIITERLGNFKLNFDTVSFFQVNTGQAEKLFSYASGLVEEGAKNILELYSGVGSLTCWLAERSQRVTSVEEWRGAVRMAAKNLAVNNFENVNALCGRSEEVIEDLKLENKFDAVVLDPPRDGCDRRVLEAIKNFKAPQIIYVSCNPATLARDCKILSSFGYDLKTIKAFDMFPQTAHVETVVLMSRLQN